MQDCRLWRSISWLCWGLTSQSTIFQSYRDGAIASWVINQYFRGVKCLAQGHNTAVVGLEPRTSRSGVRHSTTEPPRSPRSISETVIENVLVYSCCKQSEKRLPASEIESSFENFWKKIKAKWISLLRSDRAKSADFGQRTRPNRPLSWALQIWNNSVVIVKQRLQHISSIPWSRNLGVQFYFSA